MSEPTDAKSIRAGQYVRCSRCGRRVGPSDPARLPDEEGGVEGGFCVTGLTGNKSELSLQRITEREDQPGLQVAQAAKRFLDSGGL